MRLIKKIVPPPPPPKPVDISHVKIIGKEKKPA